MAPLYRLGVYDLCKPNDEPRLILVASDPEADLRGPSTYYYISERAKDELTIARGSDVVHWQYLDVFQDFGFISRHDLFIVDQSLSIMQPCSRTDECMIQFTRILRGRGVVVSADAESLSNKVHDRERRHSHEWIAQIDNGEHVAGAAKTGLEFVSAAIGASTAVAGLYRARSVGSATSSRPPSTTPPSYQPESRRASSPYAYSTSPRTNRYDPRPSSPSPPSSSSTQQRGRDPLPKPTAPTINGLLAPSSAAPPTHRYSLSSTPRPARPSPPTTRRSYSASPSRPITASPTTPARKPYVHVEIPARTDPPSHQQLRVEDDRRSRYAKPPAAAGMGTSAKPAASPSRTAYVPYRPPPPAGGTIGGIGGVGRDGNPFANPVAGAGGMGMGGRGFAIAGGLRR